MAEILHPCAHDCFPGDRQFVGGHCHKGPSAELRPDQKDSDSLPAYEIIDPVMSAYVEENLMAEGIAHRGFKLEDVEQIIHLIDRSEFKRRQSPPGIKIMPGAFGKDWRLPITNAYRP